MELEELFDNKYPHATFHDAIIESIKLDYKNKEARLELNVCVGNPDAVEEESRELRCSALLILTGLVFCVVEPPELQFYKDKCNSLLIGDDGKIDTLPNKYTSNFTPLISELKICHYFFVSNWNSFIFLGANDAFFHWT
jgi:hypothetical protein